jgi:hypothetical protein
MGRGKGMDSALWVMQGDCPRRGGKLAARVTARTSSLFRLLRFIVFVAETRGRARGRACIALVLCGSIGLLR